MLQSVFQRLTGRLALSDDEASDAGDFVVPILTKGEDNVFGNDTRKAEIEDEEDIDKQDRDEDMAEDEYATRRFGPMGEEFRSER